MLRKKSGELVRPSLRPSPHRRPPSSMPETTTFPKAVHFDQHLEHVRYFLQVDRPLAISTDSSLTESYDGNTELLLSDEDSPNTSSRLFEWEIVASNFPAETPDRLRQPVLVERVFLLADNNTLAGSVAVANLAFQKTVIARFTLDYWKTTSEVLAEYNNDIHLKQADGYDRFNFNIKLSDQANLEAKTMFFCVRYAVNGVEYWDNNNLKNFRVNFRKKAKKPLSLIRKAFSNRYDFGASLSATIQATNASTGECSGIAMKSKPVGTTPMLAASLTKPMLASHSYNELLTKYCFVCVH